MITRREVVDFARSFIGTPYRHQGRSKVFGVDCAGILVLLANKLNIYWESKYSLRYARNPEFFILQSEMDKYLEEITWKDIRMGDVLLFKITKHPQHVGIVSDYAKNRLGIVHTYESVGKVVEHRLNEMWMGLLIKAYKIPGVIE
jgi:cell wall-associated NlpC family hydrolase